MTDRDGCIVCGSVMGGEADPLRCHDCVANGYMVQTGVRINTLIRLTDNGPVAEAASLDGLTVERLARALTSTYNEDVATQDPDDDDRAAARRILAALRDEP